MPHTFNMKKLNFDVFALITPLNKPISITPDTEQSSAQHSNYARLLANSIRANKFELPQVALVGKQVVKGPGHVRVLYFGPYQVRDFALRKVINSLSQSDWRAIHSYLWNTGTPIKIGDRWIETDPIFNDETERAFRRVFNILDQLSLLEPSDKREE